MILFSPNHHLLPTAVHGDGLWVFMWVGETGGPLCECKLSYNNLLYAPPKSGINFRFLARHGTIAIAVFDGGGSRVVIRQEDALPDTARIGVIDGIVDRRRRRRSIVAVVVRSSSILPPLLLGALVARGRRRRWRVRPIVRRGYAACRARVRIGSGGGTRYVSPRRARGERDREHGRYQGIVQEGA